MKGEGLKRNKDSETDRANGERPMFQVSLMNRAGWPMSESGAQGPILCVSWNCRSQNWAELREDQQPQLSWRQSSNSQNWRGPEGRDGQEPELHIWELEKPGAGKLE